jgi:hypothetical protein
VVLEAIVSNWIENTGKAPKCLAMKTECFSQVAIGNRGTTLSEDDQLRPDLVRELDGFREL